MSNIANKRIAVTTPVWETLSGMRKPGQSFSGLFEIEMIPATQQMRLIGDLDKAAEGEPVSLEEAKKIIGVK
jgi:hypothetical protein